MQGERRTWVRVLMEDPSELRRSQAHAQMGRLELSADNRDKALLHFHEALELDPTDEATAEVLRELEAPTQGSRSRIGRLWSAITGQA